MNIEELRRGTAVHEAGHAIVALSFGLTVRKLDIRDGGEGGSEIECATRLPIVKQIAVAAAGMEAVAILEAPTWRATLDEVDNRFRTAQPSPRPRLPRRVVRRRKGRTA